MSRADFDQLMDAIESARGRGDGTLSKALAVHVLGADEAALEQMGLGNAPDLEIPMSHLEGLSDAEFLVWLRNRLIHRYAEQSDIVDRLTRMAEWLRLEESA